MKITQFAVTSWHTRHHDFIFEVMVNNIPSRVEVTEDYVEIRLGCKNAMFFPGEGDGRIYFGEDEFCSLITEYDGDNVTLLDEDDKPFVVMPKKTWEFFCRLGKKLEDAHTYIDALTTDENGYIIAVLDGSNFVMPDWRWMFDGNDWAPIDESIPCLAAGAADADEIFHDIKDMGIPFRPCVDVKELVAVPNEELGRFIIYDEEVNKRHTLVVKENGHIEFGSEKNPFIFDSADEMEKLCFSRFGRINCKDGEKIVGAVHFFKEYGNHEVLVALVDNKKYIFTRDALKKAAEIARIA